MNNRPQSRSDRRRKPKKKKTPRRRIYKLILVLLLMAIGSISFVGWRVYQDINNATKGMYTEVDKENLRNQGVNVANGEDPFSVLLLGVDSGLERSTNGLSDTMIVATVNPKLNRTTLVSIPRDTYTEIVGRGTMNKINHAYSYGGASMAINTVQKLLDIPIDYHVEVNMEGLRDIIDAIGGVEVTPPLSFTQSGYTFVEGEPTNLTGNAALAYSRMRKQDPSGDYGRQKRQRQVINSAIKKMASFSSLVNYQSILRSLSGNVAMNLTFSEMVDMFNHYRGAAQNIEQVQMTGYGQTINGVYYEIIPEEEIDRVSGILKEELEIEDTEEPAEETTSSVY